MTNFKERYLLYFQYGLGGVMFLEVVASIIIFTTISDGGSEAVMVIFFILTLLVLSSFINQARLLRASIILWFNSGGNGATQT